LTDKSFVLSFFYLKSLLKYRAKIQLVKLLSQCQQCMCQSVFGHLHQEASHLTLVYLAVRVSVNLFEHLLDVLVTERAISHTAKGVSDECPGFLKS